MISEDTKATLLLTGRFAGEDFETGKGPFALGEYNELEKKLHELGHRPGDLLEIGGRDLIMELFDDDEERARLDRLIGRGAEIAMRLSHWEPAGIRVFGRSDADYPAVWSEKLGVKRPMILFCIGSPELINGHAIGVVGSRDVDDEGRDFAVHVAEAAVRDGFSVISGFARGVDQYAMSAALASGGSTVGVVADSLLRNASKAECLEAIGNGQMTLISTCSPDITRFLAWRAMERNKYIYTAAEATVVVETALRSGGTWTGATEAIKKKWGRVFVRSGGDPVSGRAALEHLGATPVDDALLEEADWHATETRVQGQQEFNFGGRKTGT